MTAPLPDPLTTAYYPLTFPDVGQQGVHMAKAWLVEGAVDVEKIQQALDRVVKKWPMLAGRVEKTSRNRFRIRIPLGDLPAGYEAYTFTSEDSELPLSHYTPLPIPSFSRTLPDALFISPATRKLALSSMGLSTYAAKSLPLTHWHVTRFPKKGEESSCIGMTYSHGVFDGLGSTFIVRALEVELAGREWDVPGPAMPMELRVYENELEVLLRNEVSEAETARDERGEKQESLESIVARFSGMCVSGLWGMLLYMERCLWIAWREVPAQYGVIIPYQVHTKFAEELRREAKAAGLDDARAGTGDAIFAWLLKTVYTDTVNPVRRNRTVGMFTLATLRNEWGGKLTLYPHNCILGTSGNPALTSGEIAALPTHHLAHTLAKARLSASRLQDARWYWRMWQAADRIWPMGMVVPAAVTDDAWTLTNVSVARAAEIDLGPAGGGKTLTNYVFGLVPVVAPLQVCIINGRLGNGDLVVACLVTERKGRAIEEGLRTLLAGYA
ncbi:hypothetical protein DFP72DRAFT_1173274 [Ephemerocybe angulata]|uniref:Uncharacterized protein n=1 Tax=Ephemerocybe angulata TaxID=980116 RepID=A0A8H6HPA4_9AGAR|nr:hypothetical protein DFP72DRAFT_1173274 [Tulosesus angulatus]